MKRLLRLVLLFIGSIMYRNNKSKILFYHDVFSNYSYKSLDSDVLMGTSIEMFKKHINTIYAEGYQVVSRITSDKGQVCIMFDDGFRGIWDNRHYFYENGIEPTIFIAVDLIGKDGFLTKEEIIELQNSGFLFGCHSWTHTNLANKNDKELEIELGRSKSYLSSLLNKEINQLCLPIGYFSDHLIEKCHEYGYTEIYSSIPGNFFEKTRHGLEPRNLCQFASIFELKLILRGGNDILRKRYEKFHFFEDKL